MKLYWGWTDDLSDDWRVIKIVKIVMSVRLNVQKHKNLKVCDNRMRLFWTFAQIEIYEHIFV